MRREQVSDKGPAEKLVIHAEYGPGANSRGGSAYCALPFDNPYYMHNIIYGKIGIGSSYNGISYYVKFFFDK